MWTTLPHPRLQEGAFDEAVKGVDAIEHTASPFHFKADEPDGVSYSVIINQAPRFIPRLRIDWAGYQRHSGYPPKCSQIRVRRPLFYLT